MAEPKQREKYLRQPFYLGKGDGGERRARKLERLTMHLGATSQSEALRRIVDMVAEAAGIGEPGDQIKLKL